MGTVLILGGTGQVGRAAAGRLARDGWEVTLAARNRPDEELAEFRFRPVDRTRPGALEAAVEGVDVLVDLIPYTPADGRQLVSLAGHVSSIIRDVQRCRLRDGGPQGAHCRGRQDR